MNKQEEISEHLPIARDLANFSQLELKNILYADELSLPVCTRFMILGRKSH